MIIFLLLSAHFYFTFDPLPQNENVFFFSGRSENIITSENENCPHDSFCVCRLSVDGAWHAQSCASMFRICRLMLACLSVCLGLVLAR